MQRQVFDRFKGKVLFLSLCSMLLKGKMLGVFNGVFLKLLFGNVLLQKVVFLSLVLLRQKVLLHNSLFHCAMVFMEV